MDDEADRLIFLSLFSSFPAFFPLYPDVSLFSLLSPHRLIASSASVVSLRASTRTAPCSRLSSFPSLPCTSDRRVDHPFVNSTLSPCSMCTGAMILFGIKRCVMGENDTFTGSSFLFFPSPASAFSQSHLHLLPTLQAASTPSGNTVRPSLLWLSAFLTSSDFTPSENRCRSCEPGQLEMQGVDGGVHSAVPRDLERGHWRGGPQADGRVRSFLSFPLFFGLC
jgi:hypothetical protein